VNDFFVLKKLNPFRIPSVYCLVSTGNKPVVIHIQPFRGCVSFIDHNYISLSSLFELKVKANLKTDTERVKFE